MFYVFYCHFANSNCSRKLWISPVLFYRTNTLIPCFFLLFAKCLLLYLLYCVDNLNEQILRLSLSKDFSKAEACADCFISCSSCGVLNAKSSIQMLVSKKTLLNCFSLLSILLFQILTLNQSPIFDNFNLVYNVACGISDFNFLHNIRAFLDYKVTDYRI